MATFSGSSVLATVGGDSFPNLKGFKTVTKHPVSVCLATGIGIGRGSYCSRRRLIISSTNNIIIMAAETEKLGIKIVKNPPESKLSDLGVRSWPKRKKCKRNHASLGVGNICNGALDILMWGCPPSKFPWTYSSKETCYLLEGKVKVYPDGSDEAVEVGAGDLVVFPKGMSCTWDVSEAVDKHYKFD